MKEKVWVCGLVLSACASSPSYWDTDHYVRESYPASDDEAMPLSCLSIQDARDLSLMYGVSLRVLEQFAERMRGIEFRDSVAFFLISVRFNHPSVSDEQRAAYYRLAKSIHAPLDQHARSFSLALEDLRDREGHFSSELPQADARAVVQFRRMCAATLGRAAGMMHAWKSHRDLAARQTLELIQDLERVRTSTAASP